MQHPASDQRMRSAVASLLWRKARLYQTTRAFVLPNGDLTIHIHSSLRSHDIMMIDLPQLLEQTPFFHECLLLHQQDPVLAKRPE